VFALFRNTLTRLPKAYWLRPGASFVHQANLVGYGIEARFLIDAAELRGHTASVEFAFFPIQKADSS
jgi:hypothetical protein